MSACDYQIHYTFPEDEKIWTKGRRPTVLNQTNLLDNCTDQASKKDVLHQFISDKNVIRRVCKKYVPKTGKEDGRCQCGRSRSWHIDKKIDVNTSKPGEQWKPNKTYTTTKLTDAFGVIDFRGFGNQAMKTAPYICVDSETSPSVLRNILSDHWDLPAPKLIISVTGGAKSFYMKTRLKTSFKRGLINAATSTGAWIITGGTSTGVMEFVGEAVSDYHLQAASSQLQVVALGIATWGIVNNRQSLVSSDGEGQYPANYSINALGVTSGAPLDHNHSHFILVDDGSEGQFGVEIRLRAALEQHIAEEVHTGVSAAQSVNVPVVLLVLEGGENTMATAAEAIKRKIPVVVIEGSGRCADLISYAYKTVGRKDNEDVPQYPANFDEDIKEKAAVCFDWTKLITDEVVRKAKEDKCVVEMRAIIDAPKQLTVFRLDDDDSTNEIDEAILEALLKVNKSDVDTQLKLALAWNRSDVARHEIFNLSNRDSWKNLDLDTPMFEALVHDRFNFVKLFIDSGVNFKKFLTIKTLRDLYDRVLWQEYDTSSNLINSIIEELLSKWHTSDTLRQREHHSNDPSPTLLAIIGHVIKYLIADNQENIYAGDKYVVRSDVIPQLTPKEMEMKAMTSDPPSKTSDIKQTEAHASTDSLLLATQLEKAAQFMLPEKQLFLWAVLFNRRELAQLFWRLSIDHIGSALFASTLLKSLSTVAAKEEEVDQSTDLLNHADEWEEVAVGVLNECYQKDKWMSHRLLTREIDTWSGFTLLSMAHVAGCMDFMGHSCCQTKLNRIWRGRMALYTSTWKIIVNLVFFWCFIPMIKFSAPDDDTGWDKECNSDLDLAMASKDAQWRRNMRTGKLYSVRLWSCCHRPHTISMWHAIYYFHTAPIVKFWYHTLSYVAFVTLFSIFLMTDLRELASGELPSFYEMAVWVWAATMFIEEVRQIFVERPSSFHHKLQNYFSSMWNVFDVLLLALMILSISLRFTLTGHDFEAARKCYAITLICYYIRFLHVFYVSKNIGPKVIMIKRMITDLIFFMAILIVGILAYGVASQALRFPNSALSPQLLKDIVYLPYWQMYGELFLEEVEGDVAGCSNNATIYENSSVERCPQKSWLAIVIYAIYMILTNILLLNLLIAMFSYTFERVQENSEKVWRFFRYALVFEFLDRPAFCPPFIFFNHIFRLCRKVMQKNTAKDTTDFEQNLDDREDMKLTAFERAGMENYLYRKNLLYKEHIDVKVTTTGDRIEKVIDELEKVKEQFANGEEETLVNNLPISKAGSSNNSSLQVRMAQLERQLQSQTASLQKVIALLEKK